jgi:hypothetical protein
VEIPSIAVPTFRDGAVALCAPPVIPEGEATDFDELMLLVWPVRVELDDTLFEIREVRAVGVATGVGAMPPGSRG